MMKRLSTHDVTNTIDVSDWQAVCHEVHSIFVDTYPTYDCRYLHRAFEDMYHFYMGKSKLFYPCDTPYHDLQHSLDMTLALARLISGYERTVPKEQRLGCDLATAGLIIGLYHDSGYLRRVKDRRHERGAEYTSTHVSRGIQFMGEYLPSIGLHLWHHIAEEIMHFTGYEISIHQIKVDDPKHFNLGCMLGSADLMAQMADRCYLEKCRDRLFEEFVLGGLATRGEPVELAGEAIYRSAEDLLRKTPKFVRAMIDHRMGVEFRGIYKYMNCYFDHQGNPYLDEIEKHVAYIEKLIALDDFSGLRRNPGWTLAVDEREICLGKFGLA